MRADHRDAAAGGEREHGLARAVTQQHERLRRRVPRRVVAVWRVLNAESVTASTQMWTW